MRYTVLAVLVLLLAGCGGGGSKRGSSPPPVDPTQQQQQQPQQQQRGSQGRTISADVARPLTGPDCTRQLLEQAGRLGMNAVNVQVQATPTGFTCTGQLAPR
jgi:hypothetical protein